jgi:hypothetical protein
MVKDSVKILVIQNQTLISQIEEVGGDIGQPDCKLIEPFLVKDEVLTPWLVEYTSQNTFMLHSDKILTIAEPNSKLLKKYEDLLK